MARFLIAIVAGPDEPREVELEGPLEIGREAEAGLALATDEQVSRRHARLEPLDDGVRVTDLGSRNGTYVNTRRVTEPTVAAAGDTISLGETKLEVRPVPEPVRETVIASLPTAGAWFLALIRGSQVEREIPLDGPIEVGRDRDLDLVLDDEQVSRRHARFAAGEDGVLVEDLGSKNGTLVNGRRIRRPTQLEPGDHITIGETALELRDTRGDETKVSAISSAAIGRPGWTFAITSAALFMAVLDGLVVTFALPQIQQDLNASLQALEWTVNAFTLVFAAFLLTGATVGDRFGRKRMMIVGVVIFSLTSMFCALAPNMETLLAARAAQGVGAALIMPLSLTLVSTAFPDTRRGLALGAWSATAGLATALGPVIGGVIVTGLSWQWIFWVNVPIGLVIAPLALRFLTESYGSQSRLDPTGLALVSLGLFGIVYGVIRGGAIGWTELEVVGALGACVAVTIAFVLWELRASVPIVAMHLFKSRAFSAANVVSFLMYFGMFGSVFLLSQFLQTAQGYSALEAGIRSLPWTGVPIIVAPIAGALTEKVGGRPLMALGLALQAVALAWIALILSPDVPFSQVVFPFVIAGAGMGFFFAPASFVVLGAVRPEEEGQASGINNALRQIGTAFGVAVLGSIFASRGSSATPQEFVDGVVPATAVGAVACAIAALAALAIPAVREREDAEELVTGMPAVGGMTPVTSQHAIVSSAHAVPQWELRSVPLAQAEAHDMSGWEPFAVAQDRLYLRRPAPFLRGATGVGSGAAGSGVASH